MNRNFYKICVAVVLITIVFDVILLIKSFDIWNIIGLLISISLLIFFTKELKKDGN